MEGASFGERCSSTSNTKFIIIFLFEIREQGNIRRCTSSAVKHRLLRVSSSFASSSSFSASALPETVPQDPEGVRLVFGERLQLLDLLEVDPHLIRATMVGQIVGDQIKDYVSTAPNPTTTIKFQGTVIGTSPPAPMVAAFSSRGPNYRTPEILKPDVIAPGVNILADWTRASGPTDLEIDTRRVEFNIILGTSMSCPHVSGLAALLRNARDHFQFWKRKVLWLGVGKRRLQIENTSSGRAVAGGSWAIAENGTERWWVART